MNSVEVRSLKPGKLTLPKTYDIEVKMRAVVFRRTRAYLANGGSMKALAKRAGLRPQTVSRLAYGETVYPRLRTVLAVLAAFGVTVSLIEPGAGNGREGSP